MHGNPQRSGDRINGAWRWLRWRLAVLLLVFGLKAAIVPVHLWLPATYDAPVGPVSALFAIMTKVGVYAIIRIFIPIFGPDQGLVAGVADPWILWLGP